MKKDKFTIWRSWYDKPKGFIYNVENKTYNCDVEVWEFDKCIGKLPFQYKTVVVDGNICIDENYANNFLKEKYSYKYEISKILYFKRDGGMFPFINELYMSSEEYLRCSRKIKIQELKKRVKN